MDQTWQHFDDYVAHRMEEAGTPALTLALFDRDGTVHVVAHGFAVIEANTPVQADTLFEIGSITKTFTGVAAVQAAEAGLLDLHAPVTRYLPWFEVRSQFDPITVHHLLSHTAGIVGVIDQSPDIRSALWALRDTDAAWPPGTRFWYSDAGYQALTLVLEAITGKRYAQLIHEGIFEPLGMNSSVAGITHETRPRLARGYTYLYDDRPPYPGEPLVPATWLEINSGDGCIASNAENIARFGRMLLNRGQSEGGALVSPAGYDMIAYPHAVTENGGYGYGLTLRHVDGFNYIGHGGDMPGYTAGLLMDPDYGVGVAMLSTHHHPPGLHWAALNFWRAVSTGKAHEAHGMLLPAPTTIENAGDYAGTYQGIIGGEQKLLRVTELEGNLALQVDGGPVALESRGSDTFYANHPDFSLFLLKFGRNAVETDEEAPGEVVEAWYGGDWYVKDSPLAQSLDREYRYPRGWEAYPGHYRWHSPWETNFRVVLRKGQLWLVWPRLVWPAGDEEHLVPLNDGSFRVGDGPSPERLRFADIVDGKALRAVLSGGEYYRFFTP